MATAEVPTPDGFTRVQRRSPFLDLLGALHVLDDDGHAVYGLRIRPEHANNRGTRRGADDRRGPCPRVHDGVRERPPLPLNTASMSVDFVGAAQVGEWLEGRAEIVRIGRSLAFATSYLTVGDHRVVRASSVLAVGTTPLPGQPPS